MLALSNATYYDNNIRETPKTLLYTNNMMSDTIEKETDTYQDHPTHEVYRKDCSTCYANHRDCTWCAKSGFSDAKIGRTVSDDGDGQYSFIGCSNPENN